MEDDEKTMETGAEKLQRMLDEDVNPLSADFVNAILEAQSEWKSARKIETVLKDAKNALKRVKNADGPIVLDDELVVDISTSSRKTLNKDKVSEALGREDIEDCYKTSAERRVTISKFEVD